MKVKSYRWGFLSIPFRQIFFLISEGHILRYFPRLSWGKLKSWPFTCNFKGKEPTFIFALFQGWHRPTIGYKPSLGRLQFSIDWKSKNWTPYTDSQWKSWIHNFIHFFPKIKANLGFAFVATGPMDTGWHFNAGLYDFSIIKLKLSRKPVTSYWRSDPISKLAACNSEDSVFRFKWKIVEGSTSTVTKATLGRPALNLVHSLKNWRPNDFALWSTTNRHQNRKAFTCWTPQLVLCKNIFLKASQRTRAFALS